MKYFISYKGKIVGFSRTKTEAERILSRLSGALMSLEIIEHNDNVIPLPRKLKHAGMKAKSRKKNR